VSFAELKPSSNQDFLDDKSIIGYSKILHLGSFAATFIQK
jgi:hypothetical protein